MIAIARSRWGAHGAALVGWALGAVGVAAWMDARPHGFFDLGFAVAIAIVGGWASIVAVVTTIVIALWRRATPRAVLAMHAALGVAALVALEAAR